MIRLLGKLAAAALVANAAWRVGTTYVTFYKFQDSIAEASQFGGDKSEDQLRQTILDLAVQYDIPLAESSFTIRRQEDHTYVEGWYTQPIEVFPGYRYPWPFRWSTDTLTLRSPNLQPFAPPR